MTKFTPTIDIADMQRPVLTDLRRGRVLVPETGKQRRDAAGRFLGIWGRDHPIQYVIGRDDGTVRTLSRNEHRLAVHFYGPPIDPTLTRASDYDVERAFHE